MVPTAGVAFIVVALILADKRPVEAFFTQEYDVCRAIGKPFQPYDIERIPGGIGLVFTCSPVGPSQPHDRAAAIDVSGYDPERAGAGVPA